MNKDQASGAGDRALTVAVTWLITYMTTKGFITPSQAADFLPLVLGIVVAVYGWWVNRPKAVLQAAANIPEVKSVVLGASATSSLREAQDLASSVPSSKVDTRITSIKDAA